MSKGIGVRAPAVHAGGRKYESGRIEIDLEARPEGRGTPAQIGTPASNVLYRSLDLIVFSCRSTACAALRSGF
jgi:hypothetical protein